METQIPNNSEQVAGDAPKAGESFRTLPNTSANFGKVPNDSETFRMVPHPSEAFRKFPNTSENFRTVPNAAERKEYCTLSVREVARMFEAAGVARTERSIINWCQVNKMGVARLDNYFDPNERKYFISPQSVELAIQEEKAKAAKGIESQEPSESVPKASESGRKEPNFGSESETGRIRELEREINDLKINNRAKDYFIEELQKQGQNFVKELVASSRKIGELETKMWRLEERTPPADNN